MYCPKCGSQIEDNSKFCTACGEQLYTSDQSASSVSNDLNRVIHPDTVNSSEKSRAIAAILAWFFGWCGVHLFYVGRTTGGILSAVFFWTGIPAIVAFIQFILILCGVFKDKDGKPLSKW